VRLLLARGADMSVRSIFGKTPLNLASGSKLKELFLPKRTNLSTTGLRRRRSCR